MIRGKSCGSLRTRTMSPAWTATSVPAPIAISTSAVTSPGASFTPSPTMATLLALVLQVLDALGLFLRQHLSEDGVDAEILCHGRCDRLGVAGNHRDFDASFMQLSYGVPGFRPNGVSPGECPQHLISFDQIDGAFPP